MTNEIEYAEAHTLDGNLGAECTEKGTIFRVWQPLAERVTLNLFGADGKPIKRATMRKLGDNGVFEYRVRGELDGVRYTFTVTRNGETVECADIYSKAVTADGKYSIVTDVRRHAPKKWAGDRPISFPDPEDAIIYEISVRDFSTDENADFKNRGKFTAFCEKKARNSYGETVGLPYIKRLGVTHIQLMPVFDFDFDGGEYNWGYNPRFYNAPSAYYSQKDGISELRSLVAAAHKCGLGVVADVVYNHVYDAGKSEFQKLFPDYYFRKCSDSDAFSNGSGCGNEFASERIMARKFIVDSLVFLASEYHLDGFRFDLMGLLDIETVRLAEQKLRAINPDVLLYGEGWTCGESTLCEEQRAVLKNAEQLPNYAFFNDSFRDAVKGSVFRKKDKGYVNGNADDWHFKPIKCALTGKFDNDFWASDPRQTINCVECHDNLTLFDKLKKTLYKAKKERLLLSDKMAAVFVLLSRGMAFIQAGQEFLRSKNGESNSYNKPDSVNCIKWDTLTKNKSIAEYYRGLIAIRKRFRAQFGEREIKAVNGGFVMTAGDFVLVVSPTEESVCPDIKGFFAVFADNERASDKPLYFTKQLFCGSYSILFARRIIK
ncbi:MAG: type I pullulanase [Oscillospiraceae bacterium]|nr:type I pullulanase [Oscillospiraceae bacterium]